MDDTLYQVEEPNHMPVIKGKRTLKLEVEVTVELEDVEYSTSDDWSALYHDRPGLQGAEATLKRHINGALGQLYLAYGEVEVGFGVGSLDIINDEENEKLTEEMHTASANADCVRSEKIDEILSEAGSLDPFCWSMGNTCDEALIAGEIFMEDKVQFIYSEGWGDEVTLVSPIYTNPTYVDLGVAASKLVHLSNDHHHIFLENALLIREDRVYDGCVVRAENAEDVDAETVKVYSLHFGS